jgi:RimJ/RimL family protein N-acetyltransferase
VIDIETGRLTLRLVPLAGLVATAGKDLPACRRLIGTQLTDEWFEDSWVAGLRLKQWKADPGYAPWSIRAICLRSSGTVIGHMNAHASPELYKQDGDSGSLVEIGYTIFAPWRRQGYAHEMVRGYGQFASNRGLRWLRLSISPGNLASLALARKLGARMIDSQIDEIDGPEDIYLIDL